MSINASDLLRYAEMVFSSSSCELGYRNSVGRAYYAAVHHCRSAYRDTQDSKNSGKGKLGSHARLIGGLLNPSSSKEDLREKSIKLGLDLQAMKAIRNISDYDLGRFVTRLDAEDMVERAQIIFEEI